MNDTQLLINPQSLDIANAADFAKFVALSQELEGQLKAAWGYVEAQMLDRGIKKVQGEWGSISLAERMNWKVDTNAINPYYLKPAADTKKLKAAFDAGETVEGADFTTTMYLTRRIK